MLACVQRHAGRSVRRVVVESEGGPVRFAIPVARLMAPLRVELVVRGRCNSSCANYLLPVARRVTLEPGAMILLHGGMDEHMLAKGAARDDYDLEQSFAAQHRVPLGWLLFRTAEEYAQGSLGRYVSGGPSADPEALEGREAPPSMKALLVEEDFLRSCLKEVELTPFRDTLAQRAGRQVKLRERLARQGVYLSGSMACRSADGPAPAA
jgi:hypothetical protein